MKLADIIRDFSLHPFTSCPEDRDIRDVYVSDLLSDVMAHARENSLWITLQTHLNIIAVAAMKNMPAIVIVNGRKPDGETRQRAESEGVALLGTEATAYEVAGRLYTVLHRGG